MCCVLLIYYQLRYFIFYIFCSEQILLNNLNNFDFYLKFLSLFISYLNLMLKAKCIHVQDCNLPNYHKIIINLAIILKSHCVTFIIVMSVIDIIIHLLCNNCFMLASYQVIFHVIS